MHTASGDFTAIIAKSQRESCAVPLVCTPWAKYGRPCGGRPAWILQKDFELTPAVRAGGYFTPSLDAKGSMEVENQSPGLRRRPLQCEGVGVLTCFVE